MDTVNRADLAAAVELIKPALDDSGVRDHTIIDALATLLFAARLLIAPTEADVERVARAIAKQNPVDDDFRLWTGEARAAIGALLEDTEK